MDFMKSRSVSCAILKSVREQFELTGAGCTTHTSTSRFGLAGPLLGRHTWSRDVVRGVDKSNVRKGLGEVPY